MHDVHQFFDRLTYANIMATVALFVSLGGASYAAFSLPAHSVGARQLQHGAVMLGDLGFPLGAVSVTDSTPLSLPKTACNSPLRSGEASDLVCPPPAFGGLVNPPQLRVHTRSPGQLLVSGLAELEDQGAADTHAKVRYALELDRRQISVREVTLAGGQLLQAPSQALVSVAVGSHTIQFQAKAIYSSYEPGNVIVSSASLIAVSLP